MDKIIKIPTINLNWSEWYKWNNLKLDTRLKENKGIIKPDKKSGVYEAKYHDKEQRLHIGKTTTNLKTRIDYMIKASAHSTGERMKKKNIDFSKVIVRWAITDRPSDTEEELHKKYVQKYGKLPEYVKKT